jgi:hypothetical protein
MIPQLKQVLIASGAVTALAVATAAGAQTGGGGGLDRAATNPEATFSVNLIEDEVTPGPGDTTGSGSASITVNAATGQVCISATTTGIAAITALDIHEGVSGATGTSVVDFDVATGTSAATCVTSTPTQAQAIIDAPEGFYLDVHNGDFADGALRGQLTLRGNDAGALRLLSEPVRAYDSRATTQLAGNEARSIDLKVTATGAPSGMPIGTRAAIVTLTVTRTVDGGYLTLFSNSLVGIPDTSTVNWTASNQDVAATTTVAVDGNGMVKVAAGPNGTHFIVDVIGYYQ